MSVLALALMAAAHATPDRALVRVDEPLRMRRYKLLRGDGPVRGRWRHSRGEHRVWAWPDGVAERIDSYDGRRLETRRRFGHAGNALSTVTFAEGRPDSVQVHTAAPTTHDVSGWVSLSIHGATALVPRAADSADDEVLRWAAPAWTMSLAFTDAPGDPTTDDYRHELARVCGCTPVDRVPVWLDGRVAVRTRVVYPHPTHAQVGEIWAIPAEGGHLVLTVVAPTGEPQALAIGRTVAALWRWQ